MLHYVIYPAVVLTIATVRAVVKVGVAMSDLESEIPFIHNADLTIISHIIVCFYVFFG